MVEMLRRLTALVVFGLVAMLASPSVMAQSPITNPQHLPRLYAEAMAASDIETIVSFYAPNGIMMTPEGPVAAGTEQIRQLMIHQFRGGAKLGMAFNQAQIDGGGGQAVTIWDWVLTRAIPGQEPVSQRVRSMIYLKQEGETWSIAADMYQMLPQ